MTTTPRPDIVGSILQLQAQRLTAIDARTKEIAEQLDSLDDRIKQLGQAQAITLREIRKDL